MPRTPYEITSQLKKSGSVTLDVNGNGVLYFQTDSANQRWEVTSVVVYTNQSATSTTVPVATLALNAADLATSSPGNQMGATWSGNQDTFTGTWDIGPCDFMSVIFGAPNGTNGGALHNVIATAVVTGTKYTERG